MKEIWKDVKNYEGLYELSNFGKVRTVERIVLRKSKLGKLTNFKINSKIKIANLSKGGYLTIAIVKENKTITTYLHRIIAEVFVEKEKPNYNVVNHINGIKTDNRIENLEWTSSSQNNIHALDNFLRETRKNISIEFIEKVKELRNNGFKNYEIANQLNSTTSIIQGITSGRTYKRKN